MHKFTISFILYVSEQQHNCCRSFSSAFWINSERLNRLLSSIFVSSHRRQLFSKNKCPDGPLVTYELVNAVEQLAAKEMNSPQELVDSSKE